MTTGRRFDADPAEAGTLYRDLSLELRGIDEEARTVPARLSTSTRVDRPWGWEELDHAPKAVQLGRAARGLPLLFSHDQAQPIGRVEDVRLDREALVGRLRFSRSARAEEIWQDVRDGILQDVSIGYRVQKWEEGEGGRTARRWEVLEASVVSVPADPRANIQRNTEVATMETTPITPEAAELARQASIRSAFRAHAQRYGDLLVRCLEDTEISGERARDLLIAEMGRGVEPTDPVATPGEDESDKTIRGIDEALAYRWNQRVDTRAGKYGPKVLDADSRALVDDLDARYTRARNARHENPYAGMSMIEMAREFAIRVHNRPEARSWSASQVADKILTRAMIGHGPDDFTNLLANNIGKMLQVGYTEAPETYQQWVRIGSLNDFKAHDRPVMSTFGDLDNLTDDLEYKYGTFSDRKESITAKRFGKLFSISRTALVNDDQSAFSEIPRHMGRAAARMVGDEVYTNTLLSASLAGPTLSDSIALFHASHSNLVTAGAAPSATSLNTMMINHMRMTDPAGNVLNIRPAYILVPPDLWGTTRALLISEIVSSNNERNIWQGELEQVTEARLTDTVNWYTIASASQIGTMEVAFIDGVQTPFLDSEDSFTRDGVSYKVRHEFGVAVLDHRGMVRNDGVT